MVKNLNEENKNIKAPLKNYTDIDFSQDNTKREPRREKVYKVQQDDLQRPTFTNSSLNEQKNFKELDMNGDVTYFKISCT